jgi:hypothetical protein
MAKRVEQSYQAQRAMLHAFAEDCRNWYAAGNNMHNYRGRNKCRTAMGLLESSILMPDFTAIEPELEQIEQAARQRYLKGKTK